MHLITILSLYLFVLFKMFSRNMVYGMYILKYIYNAVRGADMKSSREFFLCVHK